MFWVALHLPGLPAAMLEPIAACACPFTPRVALEPGARRPEAEASLRYFGAAAPLSGARRLLVQVEGLLAPRQPAVRAFSLPLTHLDGSASEVKVLLDSAARDAERLSQLLREKLATLQLREPVEAIALAAAD